MLLRRIVREWGHRCLDSISHLKLSEDLVQVPLGRPDRHREVVGDLLIRHALLKQAQDGDLRFSQSLRRPISR